VRVGRPLWYLNDLNFLFRTTTRFFLIGIEMPSVFLQAVVVLQGSEGEVRNIRSRMSHDIGNFVRFSMNLLANFPNSNSTLTKAAGCLKFYPKKIIPKILQIRCRCSKRP